VGTEKNPDMAQEEVNVFVLLFVAVLLIVKVLDRYVRPVAEGDFEVQDLLQIVSQKVT
jgi:hypothetical protein